MSAKFPRGGGGSKPILSHPSRVSLIVFLNEIFEKVNFEKSAKDNKKHENHPKAE